MRPALSLATRIAIVALGVSAWAGAEPVTPLPVPTPPAPTTAAPSATPIAPPAAAPAAPSDPTGGSGMRAYHAALARRRLGSNDTFSLDDLRTRLTEAEALRAVGRTDEAIAKLTENIEHPRFEAFAENDEGRAALVALGDALAAAGAFEPARAYLRRVLGMRGAWDGNATASRRAVRRLVEIALESQNLAGGLDDLKGLPSTLPEEASGEVSYLTGRAREAAGDPSAALAAYAQVTQRSRFWSQAIYLQGLLQVENGKLKEGENLFCKVADPKRQDKTTPVFADERFFAVRDLARLALGRIAHEQLRFDDARYYYYLVPRDSARLAEALYESATTRYEKKDYDGARELLDELNGLGIHHRYEDEAHVLDAYIDLARCKFEDADKKLVSFVAKYEPVRDAARRVSENDRAMALLLTSARTGSDAGRAEAGPVNVTPDAMRTVAVLIRLDPAYGAVIRKRAALDHEVSGLRQASGAIGDMQRSLATNGGVRPTAEGEGDPKERAAEVRAAIDGVRRELGDLEASHAPADRIAALRAEATALEARLTDATTATGAADAAAAATATDLPDLLRNDAAAGSTLAASAEVAKKELALAETSLAKDTLKRLDLRLSRLLRRARLGRIESVLGRKRALEVEIEAIHNGFLPQSAVDSLDAARYLQDNEEYWPFEGDDWPDEFLGGEGL